MNTAPSLRLAANETACPTDEPTDALYPEGIAADNKSGDFYVSSVADGSIYRGNVSSSNAELFLPGGRGRAHASATGLKLDAGRLFVAGAGTGKVFVYDASSGDLIRSFDAQGAGFLNDLAINPQTGDVYITDSFVPILWRVPAEEVKSSPHTWRARTVAGSRRPSRSSVHGGQFQSQWHSRHSRRSLPAHRTVLYRQPLPDRHPNQAGTQIDLGGATLTQGDGLVLTGNTLYVIRNQGFVTKISLERTSSQGSGGEHTGAVPEDFPTTGALVGGRLLVVNSQFDTEGGPVGGTTTPEIPFTVSAMPAP